MNQLIIILVLIVVNANYYFAQKFGMLEQEIASADSIRNRVVSIFKSAGKGRSIEICQFIPFHSILIFMNGLVDYVDISFACNSFYFSGSKGNNVPYMGIERKMALGLLFNTQGIIVE
jgi:hypothetical protein